MSKIYIIILFPILAFLYTVYNFYLYHKEKNSKELSGYDVARKMLNKIKMKDTIIVEKKGFFVDCYDEKRDVLKLSTKNYYNDSITSLVIATYYSVKAKHVYKKEQKAVFLNNMYKLMRIYVLVDYIVLFIFLLFNDINNVNIASNMFLIGTFIYVILLSFEMNYYKEVKDEVRSLLKTDDVNRAIISCFFIEISAMITILLAMVTKCAQLIKERIK